MNFILFDIETDKLPDDQLPEFDESSVKLGRMTDPEKIAAKIEEAKTKWSERFALHPSTGRVLCIGAYAVMNDKFSCVHDDENEATLLGYWWSWVEKVMQRGNVFLVGVNIFSFDLPFLVRRSWILRVPIPDGVVDPWGRFPRWHNVFKDVRQAWQLGDTQAESNFNHLARVFGTAGKGEIDGSQFADLWRNDREKAIAYLEQDVRQPAMWLNQMLGIIDAEFEVKEEPEDEQEQPVDDSGSE